MRKQSADDVERVGVDEPHQVSLWWRCLRFVLTCTMLMCYNNKLTTLDVSGLHNLTV